MNEHLSSSVTRLRSFIERRAEHEGQAEILLNDLRLLVELLRYGNWETLTAGTQFEPRVTLDFDKGEVRHAE